MNIRLKYTTLALNENQHLTTKYKSSPEETYCIGHTNGKRDRSLDGHYQSKGLTVKNNIQMRIVLFISGGVLQQVMADEHCEVVLVDRDCPDEPTDLVSVQDVQVISGSFSDAIAEDDEEDQALPRIKELEGKGIL